MSCQYFKVLISGKIQGVGFRPYVWREAKKNNLAGWVRNNTNGVEILIKSDKKIAEIFCKNIIKNLPPAARIDRFFIKKSHHKEDNIFDFKIKKSLADVEKSALFTPDIATCRDCLNELFDQKNRRFLYPFVNCTNCGPRFSIQEKIPYDRKNTTMKEFDMCPACLAEYTDPANRRFHAQPNACPECGPHIYLSDKNGKILAKKQKAINLCQKKIISGKIIAVKGIGGYHLLCDARNKKVISCLRKRKNRPSKPFALIFSNIQSIKKYCNITNCEQKALESAEAPIVLLRKIDESLPHNIAPDNYRLGVFLPYSPVHHLLMHGLNFSLIATSGNISDEPIAISTKNAEEKLSKIADLFLHHNREIARPVDDSVAVEANGDLMLLRSGRGFAPNVFYYKKNQIEKKQLKSGLISLGAFQKNSCAIQLDNKIICSQHIGDLETIEAIQSQQQILSQFSNFYNFKAKKILCDAHPDYPTGEIAAKFAQINNCEIQKIQHHKAHFFSLIAEKKIMGKSLGIIWDGTGYGEDGTIWGGEIFTYKNNKIKRIAHLQKFMLPGGQQAINEPRRAALGLIYEIFKGDEKKIKKSKVLQHFAKIEKKNLLKMLKQKINSPYCSSIGRLFDASASILGLTQKNDFEGQAAIKLEKIAYQHWKKLNKNAIKHDFYNDNELKFSLKLVKPGHTIICAKEFVHQLLKIRETQSEEKIALKIHLALAKLCLKIAQNAQIKQVALSGGCFQNIILLEFAIKFLKNAGFKVFWQKKIPCNDGGIAAGQIRAAIF